MSYMENENDIVCIFVVYSPKLTLTQLKYSLALYIFLVEVHNFHETLQKVSPSGLKRAQAQPMVCDIPAFIFFTAKESLVIHPASYK